MFAPNQLKSISLEWDQIYKLIEYTSLNLCSDLEKKWWHEAGCIMRLDDFFIGTPLLVSTLNAIWWNLCEINNYCEEYGNGPITQKEIDENREKNPISLKILNDLKKYINFKEIE